MTRGTPRPPCLLREDAYRILVCRDPFGVKAYGRGRLLRCDGLAKRAERFPKSDVMEVGNDYMIRSEKWPGGGL